MIPPDVALVRLINSTAAYFTQNAPAYITYTEHTHISAPSLGRSQDINRAVQVRQADDYAIMQDLPKGAERVGQAFPIIPYFDPLGQAYSFSWTANLKNVQITLERKPVVAWQMPAGNPGVTAFIPYASFWVPSYLPDSTDAQPHFRITATADYGRGIYPYDVVVDAHSQLPSHVELRSTEDSESIVLEYGVIQGHWVMTRATYTAPEHFGPMTFTIITDTTYDNIAFPPTAPDPRLAGTPVPVPAPT